MRNESENKGNLLRGIGEASTVGLTLVISIVIGYLGGRYIGGKLSNVKWGVIIGVILGMAAGFMELFRFVIKSIRRMEREDQQKKPENRRT